MLLMIALVATLLGWGIEHARQENRIRGVETVLDSFSDDERAALRRFAEAGKPIDLRAGTAVPVGAEELRLAAQIESLSNFFVLNVADEDLRSLENHPSIILLSLSSCSRIGDRGISHIRNLKGLTVLHLSDTRISDESLDIIGHFRRLRVLDVSGTRVSRRGVAQLTALHELCQLGLSDNRNIDDDALKHVVQLPGLTHLLIGETSVTDEGLRYIAQMRNLNHLELHRNEIHGNGLANLQGVTTLRYLGLTETAVGDDDLDELKKLTQLTVLYINRTAVTPQGAQELQAALPDCRVAY
jgi:Leucine-rich repeat (LRR) protein